MKGAPSWRTAVTEVETAQRHVAQAAEALSKLAGEIAALRELGEATARLAAARALCDGADGGVLARLVVLASDSSSSVDLREEAEALLSGLSEALGLSPVAERGEWLFLSPEELGEFDVRGAGPDGRASGRGLYCVIRPGWRVGPFIVERPLVEPVGPGAVQREGS